MNFFEKTSMRSSRASLRITHDAPEAPHTAGSRSPCTGSNAAAKRSSTTRSESVRFSIVDFDPRGGEEITAFTQEFGVHRFFLIPSDKNAVSADRT